MLPCCDYVIGTNLLQVLVTKVYIVDIGLTAVVRGDNVLESQLSFTAQEPQTKGSFMSLTFFTFLIITSFLHQVSS